MMAPLHHLSAVELKDAFLEGSVSAEEIAHHFFNRIEAFDSQLGSYLFTFKERALLQAQKLDEKKKRGAPLGKLAAIPIALKDNIHVKGEITSCASKALKTFRSPFSATVTDLMEKEDAILLGKTNLDEFAMGSSNETSAFFQAHNPWNRSHVPGGSSGGSSAAMAARLCLAAMGTDTGGSIRQPAAFTGVVGFKPTYGRVSRYGMVAFGSSLDQIGPMTSCVADSALIMEVIAKHCPKDGTSLDLPQEAYPLSQRLEKGAVIGVPWQFLEALPQETRSNFEQSLQVMRSLKAQIIEVDLSVLKYSIAVYYILNTAEVSTNLARIDGVRYGYRTDHAQTIEELYCRSREESLGREVKKRMILGTYVLSKGHQGNFYEKAQKVRTLVIEAFEAAFQKCDMIMMPVTTTPAFAHGAIHDPLQMYLQDIFTVPANLAGLPAISVPSGFDSQNLPFGVQFIGPQICDVSVIQYAYAYEKATSFIKIPGDYA